MGRMTASDQELLDRQEELHAGAARLAAELKHGVLTVRIPKAEHARPKRIQVELG